jgi:hypothetical protein
MSSLHWLLRLNGSLELAFAPARLAGAPQARQIMAMSNFLEWRGGDLFLKRNNEIQYWNFRAASLFGSLLLD